MAATPDAAWKARRFALQAAHRQDASRSACGDIALAVSEAVTNVVMHAYRDRPQPGTVILEAEAGDDALLLRVRDEGRGMQRRSDSPGLGCGVALMERVASHVDVRAVAGGGTEVQLLFTL